MAIILGTAFNDFLLGTPDPDVIIGLEGDDFIRGLADADQLLGNAGVDRIFGGTGEDVIFGGPDGDVLFGEDADDRIFGEIGDDIHIGGLGDDTSTGGPGNDVFVYTFGNREDDVIDDFEGSITSGDTLASTGAFTRVTAMERGDDLVLEYSNGGISGTVTLRGRDDLMSEFVRFRLANPGLTSANSANLSQEAQTMTELNTSENAIVLSFDEAQELGLVLSPEDEQKYFQGFRSLTVEEEAELSKRYPNGYASPGGTIISDDIDIRELYSEAIDLLEKGESIEPLGLPTDFTIEELQGLLYEVNVANLLTNPETNPYTAYAEAQEQALAEDPLITYDPVTDSFQTEPIDPIDVEVFVDAFNTQLDTLPLDTEPVDPIDALSGASFFEMIFANVDPNAMNLI
ncbi:MAG: hypothetical protein SWY16_22060 [Cyanobacteriota bacterium]|nr:hypothetical protein [Cyanobacteriota bacterium]